MGTERKREQRPITEMTLQLDGGGERPRAAGPKIAALVVLGGLDVGATILIKEDGATVLGRDPECDGAIRDDGISRRHAQVVRAGAGFAIEDLDSTNGVFVNGQRVARRELAEGDKILLGRHTILKFVLQDAIDLRFQRQMYESSVRDALTGAFNRRHFDERFAAELSYARRHDQAVTLAMLDLDHFKKVNDTFGHLAGDQVLAAAARAFLKTLRREDLLARYGGEEFAVIARGITPIGGLALGERLRAEVERMRILAPGGERIPVTVSAGVCTAPGGVEVAPAELVRQADANLYGAKAAGRNRVVASELRIG